MPMHELKSQGVLSRTSRGEITNRFQTSHIAYFVMVALIPTHDAHIGPYYFLQTTDTGAS